MNRTGIANSNICVYSVTFIHALRLPLTRTHALSLSLFANLAFYRNSASPLVPSDEGMERADDKVDLPCNKDRPLYSAGSSDHVAVTGDRD